jgi:hypothetical protein
MHTACARLRRPARKRFRKRASGSAERHLRVETALAFLGPVAEGGMRLPGGSAPDLHFVGRVQNTAAHRLTVFVLRVAQQAVDKLLFVPFHGCLTTF